MNLRRLLRIIPLLALVVALPAPAQLKDGLHPLPAPRPGAPAVAEVTNLAAETFLIALPRAFSPQRPHGLFLYMHPGDAFERLPPGWASVLDRHRMVLVAPQRVGNEQLVSRRLAVATATAQRMRRLMQIAPGRLLVGGFSGGGRMASHATFLRPDLFDGALGICGMDFCRPVPRVKATRTDPYGLIEVPPEQVTAAKAEARFAIVTGPGDFRYGNLLDLYEGGFQPDGYAVKLFDLPGFGHDQCPGKTLDEALSFLIGAEPAGARRPVPAAAR